MTEMIGMMNDMTPPDPKKPEEMLKGFSFEQMRFKNIEVISAGVLYRGVLIGADEHDIFIKGRLRWLILPLDRITSIRLEGEQESFASHKSIDASFYDQDPNDS